MDGELIKTWLLHFDIKTSDKSKYMEDVIMYVLETLMLDLRPWLSESCHRLQAWAGVGNKEVGVTQQDR